MARSALADHRRPPRRCGGPRGVLPSHPESFIPDPLGPGAVENGTAPGLRDTPHWGQSSMLSGKFFRADSHLRVLLATI